MVTEIRGDQTPDDSLGQWIELYNASGQEQDLAGLVLIVRSLDGAKTARLIVRDHDLAVAAGAYVVLGEGLPGEEPPFQDFGWGVDLDGDLFDAAVLEVEACGTMVDRTLWRNLPDSGTWQLSAGLPPNSAQNDEEARELLKLMGMPFAEGK